MLQPLAKRGNLENSLVTPGCVLSLGYPPKQNGDISCKLTGQENRRALGQRLLQCVCAG